MKNPVFEGTATAIVTPFRDGEVDYAMFGRLLDAQLAAGVQAVVVCGTTGEAAALELHEQMGLIAYAVRHAAGRCKIIAGTGSNRTKHAAELSRVAANMGADALLLVTPYYNKCTQKGLCEHFLTAAEAADCPVIVYSVPSRTGVEISVEACRTLSEHPRICGIKEAGSDITRVSRILDACGDDFFVWAGSDDQITAQMSLGAKGVISVLANVRPKQTVELTRLCMEQRYREAGALQNSLMTLIGALFSEVNPIPVKAALRLLGYDVGAPRLPLTELSPEKTALLKSALGLE